MGWHSEWVVRYYGYEVGRGSTFRTAWRTARRKYPDLPKEETSPDGGIVFPVGVSFERLKW